MLGEWKALLFERGLRINTNSDREMFETLIDIIYLKCQEPIEVTAKEVTKVKQWNK